jgi:hypothetical protein
MHRQGDTSPVGFCTAGLSGPINGVPDVLVFKIRVKRLGKIQYRVDNPLHILC